MENTSARAEAEAALALLMCLAREIPRLSDTTKTGKWVRTVFHELPGRTLGLLGFGPAAQSLAGMLGGFGLKCLAFASDPDSKAAERLGVRLVGLNELIRESHYLSIHLKGNGDGKPVFAAAALDSMAKGGIIVNISDETFVDAGAIGERLENGRLAGYGACLSGPASGHPLYRFANFICIPRVGS